MVGTSTPVGHRPPVQPQKTARRPRFRKEGAHMVGGPATYGSRGTRHDFRMSAGEIICLVTMVYAPALAFTPIRVFSVAGNSAWLALILSGLLGGLIMTMWVRLTTMFPDQILPQFIETILGKVPGTFINVVLLVQFLFVIAGNARIVAE